MALNLFAPYTAEDMWSKLGYEPSVALAQWRKPDPTLLVEESVTASCRSTARSATGSRCRRRSARTTWRRWRASPRPLSRSVGDREIVNVIVRAPRLVNIATKPRG